MLTLYINGNIFYLLRKYDGNIIFIDLYSGETVQSLFDTEYKIELSPLIAKVRLL